MLKRRFIPLLIIFPAALLLILLISPWKILEGDGRRIALKRPEEVDRIILTDPYNTTELNRRDGTWHLFGTEQVNAVSVENLLFAASRLEVGSITELKVFEETAGREEAITELCFFRKDKVLLCFRLRSSGGRYLLNPGGSEQAFYVSLPGYPELELDRVFSAAADHYRDHLLIDLRPSDIASIGIELKSGEKFRFFQDKEGNIECRVANESTPMPEGTPNELAMKLLFSYFTSVRYEQRTGIKADSILGNPLKHPRMATIELESTQGEHHSLQVFPYHVSQGSDPHLFKALVLYNQEREALVVNYIYLDVLMRGLSHYIGEK